MRMDAVERDGVAVVRRSSGGSAILTGPEQLIMSVVCGKGRFGSREETFDTVCGIIIDAIDRLGVEAHHKPPNDVIVDGRKVSGSARRDLRDATIVHGTIVMELSDESVGRYIVPKERPSPRAYDGVGGLREHVPGLDAKRMRWALMQSLQATLGMLRPARLSERESERVECLMEEGFGSVPSLGL